jgi:Protein of unknown function (DUF2029).
MSKNYPLSAKSISTLLLMSICVPALLLSLGGILIAIVSSHPPIGRDFLAYWAAGRQLVDRANPYDAQTILALEQSTGTSNGSAVVMRNPPTGFLLVLPLGLLPWREANLLWTAMLLAALAISITLIWKILEKPTDIERVLGYTFAPVLLCLYAGQSSLFLLLGIALFLWLHSTRPFLAGISLWLCLLKPHIFMPFGTVVLAWALCSRRYLILLGCFLAVLSSAAIGLYLDTAAWHHYVSMMTSSGIDRELLPCFSGNLRLLIDPSKAWLQFVPAVTACAWAAWYFYKNRTGWDWIRHGSGLLPLSFLASPYAWSTDQAVMLPALLFVISATSSPGLMAAMALGSAVMELGPFFGVAMHSRFNEVSSLFWCLLFLIGKNLSSRNESMKKHMPSLQMEENAAVALENSRS